MKVNIGYLGLALAGFVLGQHPTEPPILPSIKSFQCIAPGFDCRYNNTSFNLTQDDLDRSFLSMNMRSFNFQGNYHMAPGFWASAAYDVEFNSEWSPNWRFALYNVHYHGRFNATDGIQLNWLRSIVTMDYRDSTFSANASNATYEMFNRRTNTAIGGAGTFYDYFDVRDDADGLVWSPCFNGPATTIWEISIDANVIDEQIAPWQWGGFTEGLHLDWGFGWQECEAEKK